MVQVAVTVIVMVQLQDSVMVLVNDIEKFKGNAEDKEPDNVI